MKSRLQRRPTAYCIVVDLELLLDVRLGVLETLYPTITKDLLQRGYLGRYNDNFSMIINTVDQALYEKTYAERNKTHLEATGPTGFLFWLTSELEKVLMEAVKAPIYDEFFIDINFGGRYSDLSREERQEIIEVCGDIFPARFSIEEVNIRFNNLTPDFLNKNYNQVMMYNYIEWFEYHYPESLTPDDIKQKHLRMENCDVIAPGLFKNYVKPNELFVKLTDDGEELPVLEVHTRAVSPLFKLHYVHPVLASLIDPHEIESFLAKNKNTA